MIKTTRLMAIVALGALAAGCASNGGGVRPPTPSAPAPTVDEVNGINALMLGGDLKEARKRIKAALKRDPQNPSIQLLRDSIERNATDLLGPQSYAYTVRGGDTILDLAQSLLGNRLKAYQLGRYNGLSAPFALKPGQTLRIPGTAPRAEPVRRPTPTPQRPAPSTPTPPAMAKPAPKPAQPAANPARARQLRMAGLAALNQGKVANAVILLRRAAAVDPGNPLIARDLARAERIAATVRGRK